MLNGASYPRQFTKKMFSATEWQCSRNNALFFAAWKRCRVKGNLGIIHNLHLRVYLKKNTSWW